MKQSKNHLISIAFGSILFAFTMSCDNTETKKKRNSKAKPPIIKIDEVSVVPVNNTGFKKQVISNGKLYANKKNTLRFRSSGKLSKIYVKNGDFVHKEQSIARIDTRDLNITLSKAQNRLKKAEIDFKDELIGHGVDPNNMASIPDTILKNVEVRSGLLSAKATVSQAKYDLDHALLTAPFSGVIANLNLQEGNTIDNSKKVCDIFDSKKLEVRFPVMETELSVLRPNYEVTIIPYANKSKEINGQITAINPFVNDYGVAQGYAIIDNAEQILYEGMNVKLYVNITIPDLLTIPKKAVVTRSQRDVVFTYENGLAKWHYVKTGMENAKEIVILDGLKAEDSVIVSGNNHLADDMPVKLKNN